MIVVNIVREACCRLQVACKITFRRAVVSQAIYREYGPAETESRIRALSSLGQGVRLAGRKAGRLSTKGTLQPFHSNLCILRSAIDPDTHIVRIPA